MPFNTCPACNSSKIADTGKPILQNADSKYNVMQCSECKIMWTSPMPTKEDLDAHYERYYYVRNSTVDKSKFKKRFKEIIGFGKFRKKLFLDSIEKYLQLKTIVDYGCGNDNLLKIAKKRGWDVTGIDYSDEEISFFEKENIKFIKASTLEEAGIEEESLGCIILKHTIEHITDIKSYLNSIKKYLSKDGLIAIKTPSSSSLRARLNLAKWHIVNPPEHQWGFNKNNFGMLLENNGFEILTIRDSLITNELICIARKR